MFSPNNRYLISLGDENDKGLFVWEMERKIKITCNKLSKAVTCMAFADNGSYFVTAGIKHLKFWHFDDTGYPILAQGISTDTGATGEEQNDQLSA